MLTDVGFIIIAACPREEPALASRVLSSAWDAPKVAAALAKQPLHGLGTVPRESPPSRATTLDFPCVQTQI